MYILHVKKKSVLIKSSKIAAIKKFKRDISEKCNINFNMSIDGNKIYLVDDKYKTKYFNDWLPQFAFYFLDDKRGVWLKALRFPEELRHKGNGRSCVNWLINFCSIYGYKYIILGAIESAEIFWVKMGFIPLTDSDIKKYYG